MKMKCVYCNSDINTANEVCPICGASNPEYDPSAIDTTGLPPEEEVYRIGEKSIKRIVTEDGVKYVRDSVEDNKARRKEKMKKVSVSIQVALFWITFAVLVGIQIYHTKVAPPTGYYSHGLDDYYYFEEMDVWYKYNSSRDEWNRVFTSTVPEDIWDHKCSFYEETCKHAIATESNDYWSDRIFFETYHYDIDQEWISIGIGSGD